MTIGRRPLALLAAGLALLYLLVAALNAVIPSTQGPAGSSYATSADGVGALAELLARDGHPVSRVRGGLDRARLDPADTLVLLDPDAILPSEGARLRAFMSAGGRLVAGGGDPPHWLRALDIQPAWQDSGPPLATPLTASPDLGAARAVATSGQGSWVSGSLDGLDPLLGGDGARPLLIAGDVGSGRLLLLADATPLGNRLLDEADNAAFALALVGPPGRAVAFAEGVHGYGLVRGLAALPLRWAVALALVALGGTGTREADLIDCARAVATFERGSRQALR